MLVCLVSLLNRSQFAVDLALFDVIEATTLVCSVSIMSCTTISTSVGSLMAKIFLQFSHVGVG